MKHVGKPKFYLCAAQAAKVGKVGWPVIPWPAGFHAGPATVSLQFTDNLRDLDIAVHEWVGLLAYWVMGRSGRLFPGPLT